MIDREFTLPTPQSVPPGEEVAEEDEEQVEDAADTAEEEEAVEERVTPDSPTKEANGDDLADLFRTPKETDPDMRIDDIVAVDLEDDIMDGDLSDLVDVTEEDIMGPAPEPRRKDRKVVRRAQRTRPYPGLGMSRMEY